MRPNLQETAELTMFTAEIFHGKLHFFSIKRLKLREEISGLKTEEYWY